MIGLLIETCTERGLVALSADNSLLFQENLPFGYQNSTFLFPAIQRGFNAVNIDAGMLSFIAVGVGPGSYTGMRVGAMTAKTFAFTCQIPLIGISTLTTFKPLTTLSDRSPFASIIDAKIGGAYFLKGEILNGSTHWLTETKVLPLKELKFDLEDVVTLVTPNKARLQPLLNEMFPELKFHWEENVPDALQMAQMAYDKLIRGEFSDEGVLELLYMRKTQAEIERETRIGRIEGIRTEQDGRQ